MTHPSSEKGATRSQCAHPPGQLRFDPGARFCPVPSGPESISRPKRNRWACPTRARFDFKLLADVPRGLARLDALGRVANVVKLGSLHGRDDAFYKARYEATFWAAPGMVDEHGLVTDRELRPGAQRLLEAGACSTFRRPSCRNPFFMSTATAAFWPLATRCRIAGAGRVFLRPVTPTNARDGLLRARKHRASMDADQRAQSGGFPSPPGAVISARDLRPWPAAAQYCQGGVHGEVPARVRRRLIARSTVRAVTSGRRAPARVLVKLIGHLR
jgi:hypothetical protein